MTVSDAEVRPAEAAARYTYKCPGITNSHNSGRMCRSLRRPDIPVTLKSRTPFAVHTYTSHCEPFLPYLAVPRLQRARSGKPTHPDTVSFAAPSLAIVLLTDRNLRAIRSGSALSLRCESVPPGVDRHATAVLDDQVAREQTGNRPAHGLERYVQGFRDPTARD